MKSKHVVWVVAVTVFVGLIVLAMVLSDRMVKPVEEIADIQNNTSVDSQAPTPPLTAPDRTAPDLLVGRSFYNDRSRTVGAQANTFANNGDAESARLLRSIADQPGTTWLTGPSESDPTAERDIQNVLRVTKDAAAQGKAAVFQLYAIPKRDACAAYSKGGFNTDAEYLQWIDRIVASLLAESIFIVEADAIPQTVMSNCLNTTETNARYALLSTTVDRLNASNYVLGVYLDAGHSEWIADPAKLLAPLRASGVDRARGVSVNVSNFVATSVILPWTEQLLGLIGGGKKALIDTGRNGKGSPPASVTGDERWCNPAGRGLGDRPTTSGLNPAIDAYVWIKNVGESDGDCFGNPPAGTFSPSLALELARNSL